MEEQLMNILDLRTRFMNKPWQITEVEEQESGRISVLFFNNKDDFRETGYPTMEEAYTNQKKKLYRDIVDHVGWDNMEVLSETIDEFYGHE